MGLNEPQNAVRAAVMRLMAAAEIDAETVSVRRGDIALLLTVIQQKHESTLYR